MTIVHLGNVSLQIEREATRQRFVEKLRKQLERVAREVVTRCIEETLDTEVTVVLRREWYRRRREEDRQQTAARCRKCGSQYARDFRRDGHFRRYLDTGWGRVQIWVPQLECACGGGVEVAFQTIRRGQRIWDDLEEATRERSGWGMTLRESKAQIDAQLQSSVGLRTLNERIHQMGKLVPKWREQVLEEIPPVVRVDGIWITLMQDTEEKKKDALGRQRRVKRGHKVPILVAQGVWPESGRQQVVAWVIGEAEDERSWEALLTQMDQRGICPERGLRLLVVDGAPGFQAARKTVFWDVPVQRCVFHKLRNIRRALVVPEELSRRAARAYRRRFMGSVRRIWQAGDEKEARRRQRQFCDKWRKRQPEAIATLCRDFDTTLTFYRLQAQATERHEQWPARHLRTTSHLEREMRCFRRRLTRAVLFHSTQGLEAVVHQLLVRRSAERDHALPGSWLLSLERALGVPNAIS
jgi:putative transposase